ncbi:MAG: isochorismatase family protein [Planctomycetia bacterium]|nr:isochorismatase family protein [Planctomycetia bacterium]
MFPGLGDALVVIDVQRDFLAGGALSVPRGDEVIPVLNRYLKLFESRSLPIFASRDWHPRTHCSFAEQGGPWPAHCVRDSFGAEFPPELQLPSQVQVVSKATEPDREAYSDFAGKDFDDRLQERQIRRLFVGGLATEYCVLETVRDAVARGYAVLLLIDAIRPLNVMPEDGRLAEEEMVRLGAVPIRWEDLVRAGCTQVATRRPL